MGDPVTYFEFVTSLLLASVLVKIPDAFFKFYFRRSLPFSDSCDAFAFLDLFLVDGLKISNERLRFIIDSVSDDKMLVTGDCLPEERIVPS